LSSEEAEEVKGVACRGRAEEMEAEAELASFSSPGVSSGLDSFIFLFFTP
jgi:hypothetical protein